MATTKPATSPLPYRIALLPPPGPSVHTALLPASTSTAPALFHDAMAVRMEVYINEQHCSPDEEIDGDDATSWHWVIYSHEQEGEDEVPAATIRIVPVIAESHGHEHERELVEAGQMATAPNYAGTHESLWDGKENYARIGRLATVKEFRERGYGKMLVELALEWAAGHGEEVGKGQRWDGLVLAHAQLAVEKWYRKLRFETDEGMGRWLEEGIEHVGMWKRVGLKEKGDEVEKGGVNA